MKIPTARFGSLEVREHQKIRFPGGIPPFADEEYALVTCPGAEPFAWLQCLTQPQLAFVVAPPETLYGPGVVHLTPQAKAQVELRDDDKALVLCLVVVGQRPEDSTVNLLAPLVINVRTCIGKQIVLGDDMRLLRVPLLPSACLVPDA